MYAPTNCSGVGNVLESTAPVSAQLNVCEAKMHSGAQGRTRHASEGLSSPAPAATSQGQHVCTDLLVPACFNIAHHLPKKQRNTHTEHTLLLRTKRGKNMRGVSAEGLCALLFHSELLQRLAISLPYVDVRQTRAHTRTLTLSHTLLLKIWKKSLLKKNTCPN